MPTAVRIARGVVTSAISLSIIVIISGCDRFKTADGKSGDVAAYVNKEPIYKHEIKRDIALRAKYDPLFRIMPDTEIDQLDVIIDRKLIVQSAIERGLAREERFVNTIKAFWEQVLIRDFIDYKKKDFADYLFAADDDIGRYYENLSKKVTFKVLKAKDRQRIDAAFQRYLADKDTSKWQTIGPISYEEAASNAILDAFEMGKGEAKIFEDGRNYYLIEASEVEPVTLEPLANLKPAIEKRVTALKERRLFEDWLKDKRKKSAIVIKKEAI